MAKRRIRFELGKIEISGLKLEIDDDLDAATAAFAAAQQMVAGAIQPAFAQALAKGNRTIEAGAAPADGNTAKAAPSKGTRSGSRRKSSTDSPSNLPQYNHDPVKYGNPDMEWTTAQKAIWVLWVVQESGGATEMTPIQITDWSNKYFREFRTINRQNVLRDLGKEKKKNPPTVGNNPDAGMWFLYDPGKTVAKGLAHAVAPSE